MSDRAASGTSGGSDGRGASAGRAQPSVARFYDWSSNITGCVQVRQYHQADQQHQQYYQQQHQQQHQHQQLYRQSGSHLLEAAGSAQVFPVRRPSKATLTKMRQYYNPGMKLLQAGRPADAAWREAGQLTKGERHLAIARGVAGPAACRQTLFDEPEPRAPPVAPRPPPPDTGDWDGLCECTYDPRLYPVYTSRSSGPMCVVCKLRRPGARPHRHLQRDWTAEAAAAAADGDAALAAESDAGERLRAPPSTPRPAAEGRTDQAVARLPGGGRKATLDVFLPNAEREPADPLPRPSCDSARSLRTLSSPSPEPLLP